MELPQIPAEEDVSKEEAHDFDSHVETGFQIATFQGPLCAEPVEGMAYFVETLQIDSTGVQSEKCWFTTHFRDRE
jgi:ribosome assembly protein 1